MEKYPDGVRPDNHTGLIQKDFILPREVRGGNFLKNRSDIGRPKIKDILQGRSEVQSTSTPTRVPVLPHSCVLVLLSTSTPTRVERLYAQLVVLCVRLLHLWQERVL